MTLLDLVKSSMRLAGVLASGEEPTAEEVQDAAAVFADLLDSWSTERMSVPYLERSVYDLTAGTETYQYGDQEPSGRRPVRIERAALLRGGVEDPITLLTLDGWLQGVPGLYCDQAWPVATLHLRPAVEAQQQLVLYAWRPVEPPIDLQTDLVLPPGYARALRYALAADLCMEFGRGVDPVLLETAREAKAALKSVQAPVVEALLDEALSVREMWRR